LERHRLAFSDAPIYRTALDPGGEYGLRLRGEEHVWTPETVSRLQHAVRSTSGNAQADYDAYARAINDQSERLLPLRGLFELKPAGAPVPLDEVEEAKQIVKRFATGAM